MNNYFKELKFSIYLILGIILSFSTVVIPLLVIYYINFYVVSSIVVFILANFILLKIFKKSIFKVLLYLPLLPFYGLMNILTYTIPINLLLMNIFLFFSLPIVIVVYSSIVLLYFHIPINYELRIYIAFLFTYIFYITLNRGLLLYLEKMSPARYKDSNKLRPYNIKDISEYLLSENNMKILIYVFNFFAIIFINIYKFQNFNFCNKILEFEKPILQSLVTFIAFDRAITLFKTIDFKPSELYGKILIGINNKKDSLK